MLLKDRYYVLIDTETTGFNKEKHQILEVGMLILKGMEVIDELELKIKHKEYVITPGAIESNKINILEHDKEGMEPKEACDSILKFLKKYIDTEELDKKAKTIGLIAVGQNIDFDLGFLEQLFLSNYKIKEYRECISYRKLDIMQLALIKSLEGKLDIEKQDLDTILKALNIDIDNNRHRALADCYMEYEALLKLLSL